MTSKLLELTEYIEKQRRAGLVPKKVLVHPKEGQPFERTQMVRPEEVEIEKRKIKVFIRPGETSPKGVKIIEDNTTWKDRRYYEKEGTTDIVTIPSDKDRMSKRIEIPRFVYVNVDPKRFDYEGSVPGEWYKKVAEEIKDKFVDEGDQEYKYRYVVLSEKPTSKDSLKIDLSHVETNYIREVSKGKFAYKNEYPIRRSAIVDDTSISDRYYLSRYGGHLSQRSPYRVRLREDEKGPYYSKSEVGRHTVETMYKQFEGKTPSVVERTEANRKRLLEYMNPEAVRRWKDYAEGLGITSDELKKKVVDIIKPLVAKADIWIRMPSSRLNSLLSAGRFKNISEQKIKSPGKNPDISLKEYQKDRSVAENELFGLLPNVDNADRPIYGYLTSNKNGWLRSYDEGKSKHDWLSDYGDCRIKMKNTIRDRSTFTMGDTLDVNSGGRIAYDGARIIPSPLNNIHAEVELGNSITIGKKYKSIEDATSMYYNEVHIHNKVTLDDIDTIYFKDEPDNITKGKLVKAGIKFGVYK